MQYYIHESDCLIEGKSYSGAHYAYELHPDGKPWHTFRTYTVLADGDNIIFRKCLFENIAGNQKEKGQAIALYLDGDNILLEDCVIRGHQDTLFLAPLPLREREVDGFLGPKQFAPRKHHKVTFRNCLIEGGVDFIFGGASAIFENCEFKNVEPGYVFAPNTPEGTEEGFVARNCRFTAACDIPDASCYIARPWRKYARVRLENCYLGSHIHPQGWDDWGKKDAHETMVFEEIGSYGPGFSPQMRPSYVHVKDSDDKVSE